jgi:exonuclease SbcC
MHLSISPLSDDFDKILVITHLELLKDAYPVRIEVTKLPEIGSRYEIIKN